MDLAVAMGVLIAERHEVIVVPAIVGIGHHSPDSARMTSMDCRVHLRIDGAIECPDLDTSAFAGDWIGSNVDPRLAIEHPMCS